MDKKRLLKRLFGRILTPSYISTMLWLLTGAVEIVILGVALSVVLAVAAPFLETFTELLEELRARRQAGRKQQLLETFISFINAYKNVLTRYPPALLPLPLADGVTDQLERLAQYMRTLKGRRTTQYATPYEMVQALTVMPEDFEHWDLDACTDFVGQVSTDLADAPLASLRQAIQRLVSQSPHRAWVKPLTVAAGELDRAVQSTLAQWRFVQLAQQDPEIRQRVTTLLQAEAVHRQASLQTYLASNRLQCPPHEVHAAVACLRYEPVVAQVLALIDNVSLPKPPYDRRVR
jgi:hypothetical protein